MSGVARRIGPAGHAINICFSYFVFGNIRINPPGEIHALYDKWFVKPVLPNGLAFDFPMSDTIKARYAAPNDAPLE